MSGSIQLITCPTPYPSCSSYLIPTFTTSSIYLNPYPICGTYLSKVPHNRNKFSMKFSLPVLRLNSSTGRSHLISPVFIHAGSMQYPKYADSTGLTSTSWFPSLYQGSCYKWLLEYRECKIPKYEKKANIQTTQSEKGRKVLTRERREGLNLIRKVQT